MSVCSSLIWVLWSFLEGGWIEWLTYILLIPLLCVSLYWTVWLNNKRFHDRGASWWLQLLLLIPIVNFVVMLYLCFAPWEKWKNKYWEPSDTAKREKIMAWVFPIVVIWLLIVVLLLRAVSFQSDGFVSNNDSFQSRERDVVRKNDLSEIQSAIVVLQMFDWMRPWMNSATNWIPVSSIESDLVSAWLTSVPADPIPKSKNSWLGNATSNWEYLYLVATRNRISNGWFVLMAKTETESQSNRVICNDNWIITTKTDLADIKLCSTVSKWDSCSNSNGVCTYTSADQLRYMLIY